MRFRHQSTGGADAVASLSFHRHRPLAKKKRIKSNGKKYNIKKATTYGWISYSTLLFTLVCGGFFSLFHIFIGQRDANANGMNMKKKRVRGHNEIINKDDVLSFPKSDESDSTLKNNNWEDAPSSSYPCGSADSLSSFLDTHQNSTDRFSKRNPICPSAAQNHIHITVPFYNLDEFTLANAIQSIRQQEYPKHKVTIWVYDDASNSSASNQTLSNVCGQHVFDFPVPDSSRDETWLHTYQFLDTLGFNKAKDASLLCFRATRHLGPGGGKYWLLGLVRAMAKPNDIVLILDGDDTLHHKQGLQIVNQKYIDTTAWFTYGSYEGRWSEQAVDLSSDLRERQEGIQTTRRYMGLWLSTLVQGTPFGSPFIERFQICG